MTNQILCAFWFPITRQNMQTPESNSGMNTGGNVSNWPPRRSVENQFDYFPVVNLKASCNQFPWFKDRWKVRFLSLQKIFRKSESCYQSISYILSIPRRSVEKQFDYFPVVSLKDSCNQFPWFKDRWQVRFFSLQKIFRKSESCYQFFFFFFFLPLFVQTK